MKQVIIEVLKKSLTSGSLYNGKKIIKNENELMSLNTKALMKIYNQVVPTTFGVNSILKEYGSSVVDDAFRTYMINKLEDIQDATDVVFCPDIEDELTIDDDFYNEKDSYIARVYNHNMFDHGFVNFKN